IAVVEALEPALAAQVIVSEPGGHRYRFSHSLVRHAILDGIPLSRRSRLHWRAGEALAALSAAHPEPRLDEVALHLAAGVHAGQPGTAVAANVDAGHHALAALGFEDAHDRFTTAIDLAASTGLQD